MRHSRAFRHTAFWRSGWLTRDFTEPVTMFRLMPHGGSAHVYEAVDSHVRRRPNRKQRQFAKDLKVAQRNLDKLAAKYGVKL